MIVLDLESVFEWDSASSAMNLRTMNSENLLGGLSLASTVQETLDAAPTVFGTSNVYVGAFSISVEGVNHVMDTSVLLQSFDTSWLVVYTKQSTGLTPQQLFALLIPILNGIDTSTMYSCPCENQCKEFPGIWSQLTRGSIAGIDVKFDFKNGVGLQTLAPSADTSKLIDFSGGLQPFVQGSAQVNFINNLDRMFFTNFDGNNYVRYKSCDTTIETSLRGSTCSFPEGDARLLQVHLACQLSVLGTDVFFGLDRTCATPGNTCIKVILPNARFRVKMVTNSKIQEENTCFAPLVYRGCSNAFSNPTKCYSSLLPALACNNELSPNLKDCGIPKPCPSNSTYPDACYNDAFGDVPGLFGSPSTCWNDPTNLFASHRSYECRNPVDCPVGENAFILQFQNVQLRLEFVMDSAPVIEGIPVSIINQDIIDEISTLAIQVANGAFRKVMNDTINAKLGPFLQDFFATLSLLNEFFECSPICLSNVESNFIDCSTSTPPTLPSTCDLCDQCCLCITSGDCSELCRQNCPCIRTFCANTTQVLKPVWRTLTYGAIGISLVISILAMFIILGIFPAIR